MVLTLPFPFRNSFILTIRFFNNTPETIFRLNVSDGEFLP